MIIADDGSNTDTEKFTAFDKANAEHESFETIADLRGEG